MGGPAVVVPPPILPGLASLALWGGGRNATVAQNETAIAVAFATDQPIYLQSDVDLGLNLDFTGAATPEARFAILNAAQRWQGRCVVSGQGRLLLRVPAGYWSMAGGSIARTAAQPELAIQAASGPDLRDITAISYATSGTASLYRATVTVGTALPTYVVPGWPVGAQNVVGQGVATTQDGDAEAIGGALIVETVASDRLSFTTLFWFTRGTAPVSPTLAFDITGTDNSMRRNQLVIPTCVLAPISGWDGSAIEGFINLDRARGSQKNLGLVFAGTQTVGSLWIVKNAGSSLALEDFDVVAGGPERSIRCSFGFTLDINRACVGGAGTPATEVITTQGTGGVRGGRSSFGGSKQGILVLGTRTSWYATQNFVSGGAYGAYVSDGYATFQSTRFSCGNRGIYNIRGTVVVDASTRIEKCAQGMDWQAGGFINGPATLRFNTSDTPAAGNMLYSGGGWYSDQTKGLQDTGTAVSVPVGAAWEAPLSGTGGGLLINCTSATGCRAQLDVVIATLTGASFALGTNAMFVNGGSAVAATLNSGKITFQIYNKNSAGVLYLRILNEQTGSRKFAVFPQGPLTVGAFAAG